MLGWVEAMTLIQVNAGYKGSDVFYVAYPECVFEGPHLLEGFEDTETGRPRCPSCGCCDLIRVESKEIESGVGWVCAGHNTRTGGCSRSRRHA